MDVHTLAGATGSAPAPTTSAATATAPATPTTQSQPEATHLLGAPEPKNPGISPAIAKIFGGDGAASKAIPLNVSYKIENHQIHTVFSDPATGEEIAQFPPDLLAHVAAFFDQEQGVTLDQNV